MISLPEQFHAARQTQIDKQFQLLRVLGEQALDNTGRVLALNLDASRAAVEHSSSAMRQLLAMRDPRDLLNIGAQSQRQLRTMFDYGRELFSIATGLRGLGLQTYSVAPGALAAAPLKEAEIVADATAAVAASAAEVLSETAPAAVSAAAPAPEAAHVSVSAAEIAPDSSPVVTSDVAPPVEPTPIARAASEALEVPLAPPHPVAASVPVEVAVEIEIPKIEPVEATPPVATPAHGAPKVTEIRSGRGRKKQS
jgi:hypothetical protein